LFLEQIRAAKQWTTWEARICSFIQEPLENIGKYYSLDSTIAFASIESHYFQNKGFFPTDDYLLDRNNLKKLRPIPTIIIQGRYDIVCPPISAYELWKGLPHAEFWYAHRAGHVPADEEMIELLVKATEEFKSL
jgi:proline iminopeptidase